MGKLKLNSAGVRALLRSPEMQSVCIAHANAMAASDPGEHSVNSRVGKTRVNAEIVLRGPDAAERKEALAK